MMTHRDLVRHQLLREISLRIFRLRGHPHAYHLRTSCIDIDAGYCLDAEAPRKAWLIPYGLAEAQTQEIKQEKVSNQLQKVSKRHFETRS